MVRTDCGTENTNLSFIQPYLRRLHTDCFAGIDSFRYGRSVANQVCHNTIIPSLQVYMDKFTIVFNRG